MENIIQIKLEELYPHPKNPRLNIGDVTELAESIKAKGIMQNLTVVKGGPGVPEGKEGYTVIIGHRRCEAAQQAGLESVPCAVVEMDEPEQVSTMLLENMQRSDLTIYEQAQGIQMMLDLGSSVKDISEKTGFSLSTIDRRRKLLVLDKDKFYDSQSKNVTLEDYIRVSEIEDEATRNRVFGFIGTNNFEYEVKKAIEKQEKEKVRKFVCSLFPENVKVVDTYQKLPNYSEREQVFYLGLSQMPSDEKQQQLKEVITPDGEYFAYDDGYWSIAIYTRKEHTEQETKTPELSESERKERERKDKLASMAETFDKLRDEFLEKFTPTKQNADKVMQFCSFVINAGYGYEYEYDFETVCEKMGVDFDEPEEDGIEYEFEKLKEMFEISPIKTLYYQCACVVIGSRVRSHYNWNGEYDKDAQTQNVYAGLEAIGYVMSDDEKAYLDGTHELFVSADE